MLPNYDRLCKWLVIFMNHFKLCIFCKINVNRQSQQTTVSQEKMKLNFREYAQGETNIIILHGLLGSARNWHSIASNIAGRILIPDMRNHGDSPHSMQHDTADMVLDIIELQESMRARPAIIIGHSMGGLVAMQLALTHPENVKGLIVIDIAPGSIPSKTVAAVLSAMRGLKLQEFTSKQEIDMALSATIQERGIRQFVMTNLRRHEGDFQWRVNLEALCGYFEKSRKRQVLETADYGGHSLFIRGGRSNYVRDADFDRIQKHFPGADLLTVEGAGHWVHADAPTEIIKAVNDFIQESG